MKLRLLKVVVAILIAGFAALASAETMKIGIQPLNHSTAIYAKEKGFFAKYGLEVDVSIFQTGPTMVQAILSGDIVGGSFSAIPVLNLATKGVPLYSLVMDGYPTPQNPAGAIMVREDEQKIRSFKDLKGKAIGQLGIGTLTYMELFPAAEKYGIKRNDFREIYVPFPQMGQLLNSKQVDAVYVWPPYDTFLARGNPGAKVLVNESEWSPYIVASMFTVSKQWADKHPDTLIKFVKAYIEAGRWANDNPVEAKRIAGKWMNIPEETAQEMRMLYWPRNGYVLMPGIWDIYLMMVKTGQLKPVADPAAMLKAYYIDPAERFVTPALKELGMQPDPVTDEMLKIRLPNMDKSPQDYAAPWQH